MNPTLMLIVAIVALAAIPAMAEQPSGEMPTGKMIDIASPPTPLSLDTPKRRSTDQKGSIEYPWVTSVANVAVASSSTDPFEPMMTDSVTIMLTGQWLQMPPPQIINYDFGVSGNTCTFTLHVEPYTGQFMVFYLTESVGPFPIGNYAVQLIVIGLSPFPDTIPAGFFRVYPYSEPILIWEPEVQLTSDSNNSNSAPAASMHNDQLYLAWNHTYEGAVSLGILTPTGLLDMGVVANTVTGCGLGIASYGNILHTFFGQGTYPIYHLFGKAVDPNGPLFQLTTGNVYDRYGAAAIVFKDSLFVFFKRWIAGPRYILYKTFDGITWSGETTVAEDEYGDARPSVAVLNDILYLFYDGGGRYRTFNGGAWSSEKTWGAADLFGGYTPAVVNYDDTLYLFFRYRDQQYSKRFNGTSWTAARSVPMFPPDEVRDMACAVDNNLLHLFWGSWYSWSRSEIFVKSAHLECCESIRGNVDSDPADLVSVADLTYLVDFLFRGGPEPQCSEEGDVDGDGNINIADLTYLVAYLFQGGPPPPPCP